MHLAPPLRGPLRAGLLFALAACSGSPKLVDDAAGPAVAALSPAPGDAGVAVSAPIRATFSKPIEAASLTATTVLLTGTHGEDLSKTWQLSADGTVLTVTPVVAPQPPATLTVTLTAGIRDRVGNALTPPAQPWRFSLPLWLPLGALQAAFGPTLALDAADVPWLAVHHAATSEMRVSRWDGASWAQAGAAVDIDPTRTYSYPSLSLDGAGRPVALWAEFLGSGSGAGIYAKRWDGSAWSFLGGAMNVNLADSPNHRRLAPGRSDHPVATWTETVTAVDQVYVKQWDGKAWQLLGGGPLTSDPVLGSGEPSLALDGAGAPWVAYQQQDALGATTVQVRRWDGTAWQPVGGALGGVLPDLDVRGDAAFVAFAALGPCGTLDCSAIQVLGWTAAGGWVPVGGAQSRGGAATHPVIRQAPSGALVLLWKEVLAAASGTVGEELYLSVFEGGSWSPVGGAVVGGPGSSFSYRPTLELDSAGVPHIAAGVYDGAIDGTRVVRQNR